MKIFTPLSIAIRVLLYGGIMYGIAEGIFYDAGHPRGSSYFGEITFTEIGQEIILFLLFAIYIFLARKWEEIRAVSNIVGMFFLISFIREFNFLIDWWTYPALLVLLFTVYLVFRDYRKLKDATVRFFSIPASAWFFSGFLITYIFSRLMGRSKFWRLMYHDESYRLAKAATEEGIELAGDMLMLIGAIEFLLYYRFVVISAKRPQAA